MPGVQGVRFHDLFWRSLEPHRGSGHYPGLRGKLLWFMGRKEQSTDPVSSRDNCFTLIKPLAGIWHFAPVRNPDVVIFYTLDDRYLNLAFVGSHHDYPYNGKNLGTSSRTADKVHNTIAAGPVQSPAWSGLRWDDPADLLRHPDVPELSAPALDGLLGELLEEMDSCARYKGRNGVAIEDTSEFEFDRYFECLSAARDLVFDVRASKLGALYWLRKASEGFAFGQKVA